VEQHANPKLPQRHFGCAIIDRQKLPGQGQKQRSQLVGFGIRPIMVVGSVAIANMSIRPISDW
jgi:hypothetical protein